MIIPFIIWGISTIFESNGLRRLGKDYGLDVTLTRLFSLLGVVAFASAWSILYVLSSLNVYQTNYYYYAFPIPLYFEGLLAALPFLILSCITAILKLRPSHGDSALVVSRKLVPPHVDTSGHVGESLKGEERDYASHLQGSGRKKRGFRFVRETVIVFAMVSLVLVAFVVLPKFWTENYGLVYLHPAASSGDWTQISRIHWLGSPSQFELVNRTGAIESDLSRMSEAGYRSIVFQTCIECLEPYAPYPTDFNYSFLKNTVGWITDRASAHGLEVYVLYYPDWRSKELGNWGYDVGTYYDRGSDNWNNMSDFTNFLVSCSSVRWVAPYCLTKNVTKYGQFFTGIGLVSSKILMHSDDDAAFIGQLISAYPSRQDDSLVDSTNCPKLLEAYNEATIAQLKDADEHIITGTNGNMTQGQRVDSVKAKIGALGKQRNVMIWCYADFPDSSSLPDNPSPQNLGITTDGSLPQAHEWNKSQFPWLHVTVGVASASCIVAVIVILSIRRKRALGQSERILQKTTAS